MGKGIRTMYDDSNRQLVLKSLQVELKKTKEHSKEWYALNNKINKMIAENLLRFVVR